MSFWEAVTWETARASGIVAYILFTLSVAVGLALTQHWQSSQWPRLINAEMHNFLALVGTVFVGIHIITIALDPFTHFGLDEILLPFVSNYRPLSMGLGITAIYLGLAILVSTWLRPVIGYNWWRRLHIFTFIGYGLATIHGIGTGTDTSTIWATLLYLWSIGLIGVLIVMRLLIPATPHAKTYPFAALITGVTLAIIAFWAFTGPMQP